MKTEYNSLEQDGVNPLNPYQNMFLNHLNRRGRNKTHESEIMQNDMESIPINIVEFEPSSEQSVNFSSSKSQSDLVQLFGRKSTAAKKLTSLPRQQSTIIRSS